MSPKVLILSVPLVLLVDLCENLLKTHSPTAGNCFGNTSSHFFLSSVPTGAFVYKEFQTTGAEKSTPKIFFFFLKLPHCLCWNLKELLTTLDVVLWHMLSVTDLGKIAVYSSLHEKQLLVFCVCVFWVQFILQDRQAFALQHFFYGRQQQQQQ